MIISIDVGIKNLSYCIIKLNPNKTYSIVKWDVINLLDINYKKIFCQSFNKKNTKCNHVALYSKINTYYCKTHIKSNKCPIAPPEYYKIIKSNIVSNTNYVSLIKNNHIPNSIQKSEVENYIKENFFIEIPKPSSASKINLIELSKSIHFNLPNILPLNDIDIVLIENQIGPLANRMKSIQGMLTQFFIEHKIYNIFFVSSINKLKNFNLGKLSYKERKLKSIEITQNILNNNKFDDWIKLFNNHKKKDDLSDSFLQGIWYINTI
ncbi:mitochondrial RNA-splicing protein MRS1 [bacterium]|nr:mitochondrial RNA-splicing protein MRS1 [bacterium]